MTKKEALSKIIAAYKIALGMKKDTVRWKQWDKYNYARNAKAASSILTAFLVSEEKEVPELAVQKSVAFLIIKCDQWQDANLAFTLETVARWAWDEGEKFNADENTDLAVRKEMGYDSRGQITGHSEPPRSRKQVESAGEILGTGLFGMAPGNSLKANAKPLLAGQDGGDGQTGEIEEF